MFYGFDLYKSLRYRPPLRVSVLLSTECLDLNGPGVAWFLRRTCSILPKMAGQTECILQASQQVTKKLFTTYLQITF